MRTVNDLLTNIKWGGVFLCLAACSTALDPTEELNQSSAQTSGQTPSTQQQTSSTEQQNPSSSASEADDPLTAKVEGTWHILHYYDLAAPHYLYTPDDGTRLTITPDSIQVYAEQTLIQGFGSTPRDTLIQIAAYPYTPLPPSTLVTGQDTLRLSQTDQGLRLEGPRQGVVMEPVYTNTNANTPRP